MAIDIKILSAPTKDFAALVTTHADFCDTTAPPDSCHRLPVEALFTPDLTVWTACEGDLLLGMGALKALSSQHGEIKSMHTAKAARGRGIAKKMLLTILATAQERGYQALWLETGVHPGFAAARALYETHGFVTCPPFGDYSLDPHSVFMTKTLETAQ